MLILFVALIYLVSWPGVSLSSVQWPEVGPETNACLDPLTFAALRFVVLRGWQRGRMNIYAAAASREKPLGISERMTADGKHLLDWLCRASPHFLRLKFSVF